jgi:hypothetical protein
VLRQRAAAQASPVSRALAASAAPKIPKIRRLIVAAPAMTLSLECAIGLPAVKLGA